jgi:hypothetical protein
MEASLRRRALAAVRRGTAAGDDITHIAALMGVEPHLLREWQRRHDDAFAQRAATKPPPRSALGRTAFEVSPALARRMRHHLAVFGPGIGAPSLKAEFPDASYRACAAFAGDFRRELRGLLHSCDAMACTWTVPGLVWAADVWKPKNPIEGIYPYVLDVRDLATGFMVASYAIERADAQTIGAIMALLYELYDPPLVLKTDNGSEFTGEEAWMVNQAYGVEQLCSPPELPSYNGACEAGHGSIRFRAELLARRDGRPSRWTLNHLEGAKDWTNDLIDPDTSLSASQRFENRGPISASLRQSFRDAVAAEQVVRWDELAATASEQGRTIISTASRIARQAISAALKAFGYLVTRRVPIRQGIPYFKT